MWCNAMQCNAMRCDALQCDVMYVCMYFCMYVCMYVCMCVINVCVHACMDVCIYLCMYVCIYVCMYVCMYVYVHMHMYLYVCKHMYIFISYTWYNVCVSVWKILVSFLFGKLWFLLNPFPRCRHQIFNGAYEFKVDVWVRCPWWPLLKNNTAQKFMGSLDKMDLTPKCEFFLEVKMEFKPVRT